MDRIRPGRVGENAAFGRFELACPATLRLQEPLDHIAVLAAQQHHGRGIVSLGVFVGLTSPQPLDLGIRMLDMPRAAHSCGTQATVKQQAETLVNMGFGGRWSGLRFDDRVGVQRVVVT